MSERDAFRECFRCSGSGFESDERLAVVCRVCRGRGRMPDPSLDDNSDRDDNNFGIVDDDEDLI